MNNPNNSNPMTNYQQRQTVVDTTSTQRTSTTTPLQRTSSDTNVGRNVRRIESTENVTTDGPSSAEEQQVKRVRYHRHTPYQIQEMEAFFKECPHPDDKQRKELGLLLGLEPMQIKFWFQNKRTQVKSQHERHENNLLRAENEKLLFDNAMLKEALTSCTCPACGGPAELPHAEILMSGDEQVLRTENVRLRQEIEKVVALTERFGLNTAGNSDYNSVDDGVGNNITTTQQNMNDQINNSGSDQDRVITVLPVPVSNIYDKAVLTDLAVDAMDELTRLALSGEPMWIPGEYGMEILNQDEYLRNFRRGLLSGLQAESSRQSAVIVMPHAKLVDMLMDVKQWSKIFCGIVTRATTSQLSLATCGETEKYDGAQQVFVAEFQVPSPWVPTRTSYFERYCKKLSEESWGIVDVSLDHLILTQSGHVRTKRRPSGCIIQQLTNGYSKIIWIEHAEVDDSMVQDFYKILVKSSLGFGAKRWVATLDRQCERLASSMAINIPAGDLCGVITTLEERSIVLRLAERMVASFFTVSNAAAIPPWQAITNCNEVRIMTRKNLDDPGRPFGITLGASTSLWLPVPPKRVFDFLRCEKRRYEWDILVDGGLVDKVAHITNGRDPGNTVSLFRINGSNSINCDMFVLQETRTDVTGSYVVYAPIDFVTLSTALTSCQPDYVALLASGFAILPDGSSLRNIGPIVEVGTGGCLLTAAFQILVDSGPDPKLSVVSVNNLEILIKCTVDKIRNAIMRNTAPAPAP